MNSAAKLFIIAFMLIITVACSGFDNHGRNADTRQKLAEAYGINGFNQIEQIRYTFNVQLGEKNVSRSWIWEPKIDQVTFNAGSNAQPVVYARSKISAVSSDNLKKIDGWFINDNYWLLFPIHLAWDRQAKGEDIGMAKLPIGEGKARCLVVTYPPEGGYTPGDVYELFLDDSFRVIQWVYRKGGSTVPTRIATWEDYRKVGPLLLSLNRQGADKNFRVWFTDVAVKIKNSDNWVFAK
jgi:hypothetical protein